MKRFAAMILAILCIWTNSALADVLIFPSAVKEIGEEAFAGDFSINDVVLPDGIEMIGSNAFANSTVNRVYLPESLKTIGEGAFPAGTIGYGQEGTYASAYFDQHEDLLFERPVYEINALKLEENLLNVEITCWDACVLAVEILDDEQTASLHIVKLSLAGAKDSETVSVDLEEQYELPDFFYLRAWLENQDGEILSSVSSSMQRTSAYSAFMNQKPEDFEGKNVLDYQDDGFAVLADDVVQMIGSASDNGLYTLAAETVPAVGDKLLLINENGEETPVKVKEVKQNADGTVTVTEDEEVYLSDFFDVLKIDGETMVVNGRVLRSTIATDLGKVSINATFGPIDISGSAALSYTFKFNYDKKWFGDDYFEIENAVSATGELKVTASAGFSTDDLDKQPEIVAFDGPISGVPWFAAINAKVSFPLEVELKANGEATIDFTTKVGFSYNSIDGRKPINKKEVDTDVKLSGEFVIKTGPKVELKAYLFKEIISASCSGQIGIELKGVLETDDITETDKDKIHGCYVCIDGNASIFIKIQAGIGWKLTEHCKGDFIKVELLSIKVPIGDFYLSIFNDKESLFKGKLTFGWGECPNYKHKTTVSTVNVNNAFVSGIPIQIENADAEVIREGASPYVTYLYTGEYTAKAHFDTGSKQQAFEIINSAKSLTIKEPKSTFTITFDANGGECSVGTATVQAGNPINVLPTATRDGYEFLCWNTYIDGSGDSITSDTAFTSDITVYAIWNATHSYKVYDIGMTWSEAKSYCEGLGGHLATITSQQEQNHVVSLVSNGSKNIYWLGGYNSSGWKWVTGEEFSYSNWGEGEPDNYLGQEDVLQMWCTSTTNRPLGQWNDLKNDGTCNNDPFYVLGNVGFICEWDSSFLQ